MATVSVYLNTHKTYADKTHPIMIRISHEKKRKLIKVPGEGFSIKPNQWDKATSLLKPSKKVNPTYQTKNFEIMQFRQRIQDCIDEWDDNGVAWSFMMLEERLQKKPTSVLFHEAMERFIHQEHDHNPTIEYLTNHRNDLIRYSGNKWKILTCSDINYSWVSGYINFMRDKELSNYTVKSRLKTIAATLNYAIKEGIASKETYPFAKNETQKHVSIKNIKLNKVHRTLPEKYIKNFFDYPCFDSDYNLNWKIYIFHLFSRMNYRNIVEVKHSDIKMFKNGNTMCNGFEYWSYQFKRKEICFLTPELLSVISWVKKHYQSFDDYIFPVIDKKYEDEKEYKTYVETMKQRWYDSREICKKRIPYDVKKLTKEQVIANPDIADYEFYHQARIYAKMIFSFSHYAQGLNLIDMAKIKYSDIQQRLSSNGEPYEFISLNRTKTGVPIEIYLNDNLKEIIDFFENNEHLYPRHGEYILPIARQEYLPSNQEIYDDVKKARHAVNTQLKVIGNELGWNENVAKTFSFYYGRHTYAQRILIVGGSNALIQKALGHKSITTTENYLEGFSAEQIAIYNEQAFVSDTKRDIV